MNQPDPTIRTPYWRISAISFCNHDSRNGHNETKANSFRSTGFPFSCKFCIINVVNWTYTIGDRREKARKKNLGHKREEIHSLDCPFAMRNEMDELVELWAGPGIFGAKGKWTLLTGKDVDLYSLREIKSIIRGKRLRARSDCFPHFEACVWVDNRSTTWYFS